MKQFICLALSFSACYFGYGQNFSVSAEKNNILYIGVDNPLSVIAENIDPANLVVKADKGEIFGSGRIRIYRGSEPGYTTITVYNNNTAQSQIGRTMFRVMYIPDPVAKVGPSAGGSIPKIVLRNQFYLRADLPGDFSYNIQFVIDSFCFHILRTDSCLYKQVFNIGNKFNNNIIEALKTITQNDIVFFDKIYATGPDRISRKLLPLVLTVTE